MPERDVLTVLAEVQDAAVVGGLLHDFNVEFQTPTPTAQEFAQRFRRLLPRSDVIVVLSGSSQDPTGFAYLTLRPTPYDDGSLAQLEELYVRPALRDNGIGTALLAHATAEARRRGATEMHINVDEVDADTRRFYEAHGFTNVEPVSGCRMLCYVTEFDGSSLSTAQDSQQPPPSFEFTPGWDWEIDDEIDWTLQDLVAAADRGAGKFPSLDEIEFWFDADDMTSALSQVHTPEGKAVIAHLCGRLGAFNEQLPPLLAHNDPHVRFRAAEALSANTVTNSWNGTELVDRWMVEEDPWVRSALLQAMVATRRTDVLPLVRESLSDPAEVVVRAAAWGLRRLTGESAVVPLPDSPRPMTTDPHPGDVDYWSVEQLVTVADSPDRDVPGIHWTTTHFDGSELAQALREVKTTTGRVTLLEFCGLACADEAREDVVNLLDDGSARVREAAAVALTRLYGTQVLEPGRDYCAWTVAKRLEVEDEPRVREALTEALAVLDPPAEQG